MAKDYVIVKGKVVRMNDAAYKIASKHFGSTKSRPGLKEIPPDLLKIPKFDIIPGRIPLKKVEVVEPVKVEPVVVEPVKTELPPANPPIVDLPEIEKAAKKVVKRGKK